MASASSGADTPSVVPEAHLPEGASANAVAHASPAASHASGAAQVARSQHAPVLLHVVVALLVPACVVLTWWQVDRALSGNSLSWAYVFEWPFFACYGVFLWWRLTHRDDPARAGDGDRVGGGRPTAGASADGPATPGAERPEVWEHLAEEDPELAAYNEYLAQLHASGKRKRW